MSKSNSTSRLVWQIWTALGKVTPGTEQTLQGWELFVGLRQYFVFCIFFVLVDLASSRISILTLRPEIL